ncbi:MAG: DUF928 domain-containing protein [Leptolyngbyaceae cyanobacterium RU_5_1]|nr:DUF928 domain-containing protein [Leptolyngbyaceae cyanobacterium RU_5_1]
MTKFRRIATTWAIATGVLSGLVLASASSIHPLSSANAQSATPTKPVSSPGKAFNSLNFSDVGRPRRRGGGGSRGPCLVPGKPPLTALVPDMSAGLTLSKSPTFWFYLPYTLTPNQSAEFVLKDEQDQEVYKTKLSGKEASPGIISLQLPSTIALKANSNYHWYFLSYCDPQNQNRFVYVNGLIRRVERPHLEQQLKSVPTQEHTRLYTNEGVWYDALTSLGDRLHASPKNDKLKQEWVSLLRSVGLEKLASEPFVPCCSPLISSQQPPFLGQRAYSQPQTK